MEILQIIWFALCGVLLAAFLIAGGTDFGAGINALLTKSKDKKFFAINSILPFWDGNQVWLITAGGALFAAFPPAYAVVLSGMYTPVILLLLCLTLRVSAIEFFAAAKGDTAKTVWANIFGLTSFVGILLIGVAIGAIFAGQILPVRENFTDNFIRLFTPITIGCGAISIIYCSVQGSIFSALRETDSDYWRKRAQRGAIFLMVAFVAYAIIFASRAPTFVFDNFSKAVAMGMFVACYIPLRATYVLLKKNRIKSALASMSLFALLMVAMHACLAFPYIIPSKIPADGLSIFSASSGRLTLTVMLWVAAIGVPLAIAYNIFAATSLLKKDKVEEEY